MVLGVCAYGKKPPSCKPVHDEVELFRDTRVRRSWSVRYQNLCRVPRIPFDDAEQGLRRTRSRPWVRAVVDGSERILPQNLHTFSLRHAVDLMVRADAFARNVSASCQEKEKKERSSQVLDFLVHRLLGRTFPCADASNSSAHIGRQITISSRAKVPHAGALLAVGRGEVRAFKGSHVHLHCGLLGVLYS